MAGSWLSSFFACSWTEEESRSINSQKMNEAKHPAISTEQAWSTKDLLHSYFSCGTGRVISSRQNSATLPAHGDSHVIMCSVGAFH